MTIVDIGIFAHNEAGRIGPMLSSLFDQDIFADPATAPLVHVLANGCRDATLEEAGAIIAARGMTGRVVLHDLPEGGKSRTWNRFVHDLSRPEAAFLIFMDADIWIPNRDVLTGLLAFVAARAELAGASSHARKDITHDPRLARSGIDRLISAAGGTLNDWKSAICGQLYVLRSLEARSFHLPIGLPVEDGFVRAMVQTRSFSTTGASETRLDGRDALFHVYPSERGIGALIRHQTRIIIGSAINAVIYDRIHRLSPEERRHDLAQAAQDPDWLPRLLRTSLPRAPYGYVPTSFLTKRLQFWAKAPNRFKPQRLFITAAGFAFDAVVYIRAQAAMARGTGAGFW